jgi:MFS family permease
MAGYRAVLAVPGFPALSALAFLARIPASAAAVTITLHVVLTLGQGYAAAGTVGAATTIGMALGAPLLGRVVDARGLRPVLVLALVSAAAFWSVAPALTLPALLTGAFLGGLLGLPVYSVVRQSIAVLVPQARRRTAFALDSMSVEVSYILGPALGSVLVLRLSSAVAMRVVGACFVLAAIALLVLDPPVHELGEDGGRAPRPRTRSWLRAPLVAALLGAAAASLLVFGTELAVIAHLQTTGQAGWIAVVNAVWCVASLTGGFVYGALPRPVSPYLLLAAMGLATLPVSLGGPWWATALLLVPAGLFCAPSLAASTATVAELAPAPVRGLLTGLLGSAITLGAALATPLTGLAVDLLSPAAALLLVGATGVCVAGIAALVATRGGADRHIYYPA